MRRRYFTQPVARWSRQLEEECPDAGMAYTVYEPEPQIRSTGILDASGNDIMVCEQMDQIGFRRSVQD